MAEKLFQKTCQPVINLNFNRLVCKALFVLSMNFMLAGHADAASEDELLGAWIVSVDFSGASQLAQLQIERSHGSLRGTLRSEFGAADNRLYWASMGGNFGVLQATPVEDRQY